MASKTTFSAAAFLVLLLANTFLATQVAACGSCKPPPKKKSPPHPPKKSPPATPPSTTPATPGAPCPPTPSPPSPSPPSPAPAPAPSSGSCPTDTLKLAACANVLNLVHVGIGQPPSGGDSCCSLLGGLADLEAAVCLCTALKANILGIVLNIPIKLSLLLNYCGKNPPSGFLCE